MKDITGKKFGRLTALRQLGIGADRYMHYEMQCECGKTISRSSHNLRRPNQNCGCLKATATHGHAKRKKVSPTYVSWRSMQSRVLNPNHRSFKHYGGRGISITPEFLGENGFKNFLAYMGERPPGTTLDRIDSDGNYERGNMRWVDRPTQRGNQRNGRRNRTLLAA
jgi:hypothetical protein